MSRYYDRAGIPVADVLDWARGFEKTDRRVALTRITGGHPPTVVEVSTVFLGIDHQRGAGPPLLFETMAFGLPDDDEICERYSTEQQACEGHAAIVVQVSAALPGAVVMDIDPNDATTV